MAVDPDFEPEWPELEQVVPEGHVWPKDGPFSYVDTPEGRAAYAASTEKYLVVNANDVIGWVGNPDQYGHGCCGNSNHVRNRLCAGCGAAIGTSIDDCWTGYYDYFPTELVVVDLQ